MSLRFVFCDVAKTALSDYSHHSRPHALRVRHGADCPLPGTAKLDVDWKDLGFEFRPTKSHLKLEYKDGAWGKVRAHIALEVPPYVTKLHFATILTL